MKRSFEPRVAGALRLAFSAIIFVLALAVVIWRQSEAHESLRILDDTRRDHAAARAERATLLRRQQQLESRGFIVEKAQAELNMRLPEGEELILLTDPGRVP